MKILIVTAVPEEQQAIQNQINKRKALSVEPEFLCTGASVPFTVFALTQHLSNHSSIDLCINAGICGSFSDEYPIGSALNIVSDTFADIGIVKTEKSTDMFEAGFWQANRNGFSGKNLKNKTQISTGLPEVSGITVNMTSGRSEQIRRRINKYNPDTESMEGAGFAFVCENYKLPWLQIRAVSNLIAERHLQKWDIPLALEQVGLAVAAFLESLVNSKK